MARITAEDCIETVQDRFELVALAAQRAKQIASGAPLTIDRNKDKDSVVALREIAEKTIDMAQLLSDTIATYSTFKNSESTTIGDDNDQDYEELMMIADEGFANSKVRVASDDDDDDSDEPFAFENDEDIED